MRVDIYQILEWAPDKSISAVCFPDRSFKVHAREAVHDTAARNCFIPSRTAVVKQFLGTRIIFVDGDSDRVSSSAQKSQAQCPNLVGKVGEQISQLSSQIVSHLISFFFKLTYIPVRQHWEVKY